MAVGPIEIASIGPRKPESRYLLSSLASSISHFPCFHLTDLTGSSVALYSVLPAQKDGGITIQYFIDDNFVTSAGVSNTDNAPVPMFKLFEADGLSDGTHVLTANITSVISSYSIGIDFATYNASFDNIDEMPTSGLSSTSPGSKGSTHKRNHVGAIVGGVVGGLAFIGIVMLALYVLRARRRQQQRSRTAATVIGRNFNSQLGVYAHSRIVLKA